MRLREVLSSRRRWIVPSTLIAAVLGGFVLGGVVLGEARVATPGARTVFTAITPCRLVDTRPAPNTVGPRTSPLGPGETFTIAALPPAGLCPIPTTATALQMNVTAVGATAITFLTIWPSGTNRPNASSLNPAAGQGPTPNAVTTGLSPDGHFNVFNNAGSVHIIVDIVGYYEGVAAALGDVSPKVVFNVGTATSIPAFQCIDVFAFGVGPASDAGKVVTGYITDSGGVNPPPSIDNLTMYKPGVIFKTSQGGTIGFVEVCNPTSQDKALPAGWKLISSVNT